MKEMIATEPEVRWPPRPGKRVAALSTAQLVAGLTGELEELIRKEVELAKTEARVDLKAGLKSFRWLGLALVAALAFVNMLFVALAMYLAQRHFAAPGRADRGGRASDRRAGSRASGQASLSCGRSRPRARQPEESWTWAKNRIA